MKHLFTWSLGRWQSGPDEDDGDGTPQGDLVKALVALQALLLEERLDLLLLVGFPPEAKAARNGAPNPAVAALGTAEQRGKATKRSTVPTTAQRTVGDVP